MVCCKQKERLTSWYEYQNRNTVLIYQSRKPSKHPLLHDDPGARIPFFSSLHLSCSFCFVFHLHELWIIRFRLTIQIADHRIVHIIYNVWAWPMCVNKIPYRLQKNDLFPSKLFIFCCWINHEPGIELFSSAAEAKQIKITSLEKGKMLTNTQCDTFQNHWLETTK